MVHVTHLLPGQMRTTSLSVDFMLSGGHANRLCFGVLLKAGAVWARMALCFHFGARFEPALGMDFFDGPVGLIPTKWRLRIGM